MGVAISIEGYHNVLWWYLLPITAGLEAIVYQTMLADGISLGDTIYVIGVAVLSSLIYRANRRIARCEYRPRVQRLEAMLRHFDSSDADRMDALGGDRRSDRFSGG